MSYSKKPGILEDLIWPIPSQSRKRHEMETHLSHRRKKKKKKKSTQAQASPQACAGQMWMVWAQIRLVIAAAEPRRTSFLFSSLVTLEDSSERNWQLEGIKHSSGLTVFSSRQSEKVSPRQGIPANEWRKNNRIIVPPHSLAPDEWTHQSNHD